MTDTINSAVREARIILAETADDASTMLVYPHDEQRTAMICNMSGRGIYVLRGQLTKILFDNTQDEHRAGLAFTTVSDITQAHNAAEANDAASGEVR